MQIVSHGDKLHEMSNSVLGENKKNITNLSSSGLAQKAVKFNTFISNLVTNNIEY